MESNVAFKFFHDDLRSWLVWILRTKHKKLVFPLPKWRPEIFHYRDIIPCHRKGYDPVSLNCSSRLDALGFSGFPGTLTQTQEEDICQSWPCGAVCITELPATQQKKIHPGNNPVSVSTAADPTQCFHKTFRSQWTGILWCNHTS